MQNFSGTEQCVLLGMLASFNTQDALNICKAFRNMEDILGSVNFDRKKLTFVLVTCRYFLSSLQIDLVADRYHQSEISLFSYSSILDGIYSRSVVNEILNDLESARFDLRQILNHIQPCELDQLPWRCTSQILCVACRLPLIESNSTSCFQEAMLSFQSCIGSDGPYRRHLPASLLLALTVAAGSMKINAAIREYEEFSSAAEICSDEFGFFHANAAIGKASFPDSVLSELLVAYRLLQQYYLFLQNHNDSTSEILSSQQSYIEPLKSANGSIINYLPEDISSCKNSRDFIFGSEILTPNSFNFKTITDPLLLASEVPRSSVGILLAAITKFVFLHFGLALDIDNPRTTNVESSSSRHKSCKYVEEACSIDEGWVFDVNEEIYSLVNWSFKLELNPGPIALWNLAYACLGVSRLKEAFGFFKQCHEQLLSLKRRFEDTEPTPSLYCFDKIIQNMDENYGTDGDISDDGSEESQTTNFSSDDNEHHGADNTNKVQIPSMHCLPIPISSFEHHYQKCLLWLGMYVQPLQMPWMPAVVFTELTIRLGYLESHLEICMNLLFEVMTNLFDRLLGVTILTAILSNGSINSDVADPKRCQFLPHSALRPIVIEDGISGMFDILMNSFHRGIAANQLVRSIRYLLELDCGNSEINMGVGLLMVLVQYGKCHAEAYRLEKMTFHSCQTGNGIFSTGGSSKQLCDQERFFHLSVAFRCFSFLYMVNFDSAVKLELRVPVQIEGEIIMQYLILLSECSYGEENDQNEAVSFLKQVLGSPAESNVECGIFLMEKLNNVRKKHPQWYSHIHPKLVHLFALSITRESCYSAESFATAISLLQNQLYYHSSMSSNREQIGIIKDSTPAINIDGNFRFWNIRYTMMLLYFYSGDFHKTLIYAEELIIEIRDFINWQRNSKSLHQLHDYEKIFPFFYGDIQNMITNAMACKVLLHISQICCKLNNLSLAKFACTEYFRILYSIDGDVVDHLVELASRTEAISDHEIINAMKFVPTMLGWKLYTGYGFSDDHDMSLEVDGICQCAYILQIESGCLEDSKRKVLSLLNLAISICPTNVRALTAMAAIFQSRFRNLSCRHQSLENMSVALEVAFQYVKKGLFYRRHNPDLW